MFQSMIFVYMLLIARQMVPVVSNKGYLNHYSSFFYDIL